ncbi:MAG: hypothetical protein V4649_01815 [Bacteroidota bacterium]
MKLVLDINDNKADSFITFIRSLDFVTIKGDESHGSQPTGNGKKPTGTDEFRKLLLEGPVMGDEQYDNYKKPRARIEKWRQK